MKKNKKYRKGKSCVIDGEIPAVILKPPYKSSGDTFIHVAIESEVVDPRTLVDSHTYEYVKKLFEVRIPLERITLQ
jgi:hypothetical protein